MVDFSQWIYFIENHIGFVLPKSQHRWLSNAIQKVANAHQLTEAELWQQVQQDKRIRQQFVDAVLINQSWFFRDNAALSFVVKQAEQHQQQYPDDTYRIWSVGCAMGQEPWSLAMQLHVAGVKSYAILGTDVSQRALEVASLGSIDARSMEHIPSSYHHLIERLSDSQQSLPSLPQTCISTPTPLQAPATASNATVKTPSKSQMQRRGSAGGSSYSDNYKYQVDWRLREHVTFAWHNIFLDGPPDDLNRHKYHSIICQNVLIYFRQFDQRDILAKLVEQCEVGGYIILAAGEAVNWQHPAMQRVADPHINAWQKMTRY